MNKKRFKPFHLIFLYLILCLIMLCSCNQASKDPVSFDKRNEDLNKYLHEKVSEDITVIMNEYNDKEPVDNNSVFEAQVKYVHGDVTYFCIYDMTYTYSGRTGWDISSIEPVKTESWREEAEEIKLDVILEDLENKRYYSGYSDMIFENKRLLDAKLVSSELDAKTGYYRANLRVEMDADNVHEILLVFTEYLLDDNNKFVLWASDINLDSVEVQSTVSEELIKESLQSINFYREEEDSIWRIGELNKLTYEIIESNVDKAVNSQVVTLKFRGEGLYMYVSGTCSLTFHFSSGWYLYDSTVEKDSIETGMLSDSWLIDEKLILEYIVNDYKLTYNEVTDYAITEDMISNFDITGRKIVENGRFQTIYFIYDLSVNKTNFTISGYVKYDLTDGFLSVTAWNEIIDEMYFNLTGSWAGYDVSSDYIAFYQLDILDDGSGILSGSMNIYSLNNKVYPSSKNTARLNVSGNIFKGTSFEILDREWVEGDFSDGFEIPVGYYLFTEDKLVINNGKYGEFVMERVDSVMDENAFYARVESTGIKKFIDDKLYAKHHNQ